MTLINANVSKMFATIDPYDVSNCAAEYGPSVARLTWENALRVATDHQSWLNSPLTDAVDGMCEWARSAGAWGHDEIDAWTDEECLALFAQNIASELRSFLDSDEHYPELESCAVLYAATDYESEPESPVGSYTWENDALHVEYYTGC